MIYWPLIFLNHYFTNLITFNIRNNFNQKNPNRGYFNWIIYKQKLNLESSRWHFQLLNILLFCSLAGVFFLNILSSLWKKYYLNVSKNQLRKLIIYRCLWADPAVVKREEKKIQQVVFYNLPPLAFYLVNQLSEIFRNLVNISFGIFFLVYLLGQERMQKELKNFVWGFNLVAIFFFLFLVFLAFPLQSQEQWTKKHRSQNERQQIQATLNALTTQSQTENKLQVAQTFQLLDDNLKKNRFHFLRETFFNWPTSIISGLNVFFYFFYYRFWQTTNFADAFLVYLLSLNIQSVFWRFREILQSIPNYHKARFHYQEFKNLLLKLQ